MSSTDPNPPRFHSETHRVQWGDGRYQIDFLLETTTTRPVTCTLGIKIIVATSDGENRIPIRLAQGRQQSFSTSGQSIMKFYLGNFLSSGTWGPLEDMQLDHAELEIYGCHYTDERDTDSLLPTIAPRTVAAGGPNLCQLRSNGRVQCWAGSFIYGLDPAPELPGLQALSLGDTHACALTKMGLVRCWGGGGTYVGQNDAPPGLKARAISSQGLHSCALTHLGHVICWGAETGGIHRLAPLFIRDSIFESPFIEGAKDIALGNYHACVIQGDQSVLCWGNPQDQATLVPGNLRAKAIGLGDHFTCVLGLDGTPRCWGRNNHGQTAVPPGLKGTELSVSEDHACLVDEQGKVHCWGNNEQGQTSVPAHLERSSGVVTGYNFSCSWNQLELSCWGGDPRRPHNF